MRFILRCSTGIGVVIAAAALGGAGFFLAAVEQSGERLAGAVLIVVALAMLAAAAVLIFGSDHRLQGGGGILGFAATIVAAVPTVALAVVALTFAGVPFGSRTAALDWAIFAAGLLFAAGGLCAVALGYARMRKRQSPPPGIDWSGEVRVTRVGGP